MRLLAAVAVLAACGDNRDEHVTIVATEWADVLADFDATDVAMVAADAPPAADTAGFQIGVVDDAQIPSEGYRVDLLPGGTRTWIVHAHDVLGAQFGVAAALEHLGFRFRHPFDTYAPIARSPGDDALGVVHQPQVRVRGLHLHTLHPIESYFAFWDGRGDDERRIVEWIVRNRGNYVQWAALDDVLDPSRHADWRAQTRDVIDYAHARGVRVGINIQLFSQASLQHALTLVDSHSTASIADQVAQKLPLVVDGLPFDIYDLSFGEFFDADPQAFIDGVNEVVRQIHALAPAAEVHAIIHVGGTQNVTYMGQTVPYYQLVKFADPSIVPDIHSVMYYDLFEDAGGAYQLHDFSVQRDYLLARLCAHEPAAYHPETAYWVAFDDSVPLFEPLYVRTRHYDLAQIARAAPQPACARLDDHLIFSSGWEWGYWLHDVAALRASYELPDSFDELVSDALARQLGTGAAEVVSRLADEQHDALIDRHLAAYLAGRDALIDAGRGLGIISQPDRVTFDDLVAGDESTWSAFESDVLAPLSDHRLALEALAARLATLQLPADRWTRELADGFAIDGLRARFTSAAYAAVLAHLRGDRGGASSWRDRAKHDLDAARDVVTARHRDLHDADREILDRAGNATAYGFGYLYMADQLCYWQRELDQVEGILGNADVVPPACVL